MADEAEEMPHGRGSRGNRREREFRRYAESVINIHTTPDGQAAQSSSDVPLTAFAQLVALRLNAKRVLISLFDNTHQYILAEATPTLSLQRDADHEDGDAMFFGTTMLPRVDDWADETIKLARKYRTMGGSNGEDAACYIPDLLADERYAKHRHVAGSPHIRSYIGVPLMTANGYAIGTLAVVDDRIRSQGVNQVELRFLRDVAVSILAHLDLTRCQTSHRRGVRMVRGLSRFMEGKDTIYDDGNSGLRTSSTLFQQQEPHSPGKEGSARTNALGAATNAERATDARESLNDNVRMQIHEHRQKRSASTKSTKESKAFPQQLSSTSALTRKYTTATTASGRAQQPSPIQMQEDTISADIGRAFERAAKLIQQAMDMAGVLFLDASAGEFGTLKSHAGEESSESSHDSSQSHIDLNSGTDSPQQSDSERTVQSDASRPRSPPRVKVCRYLGTAYQDDEEVDHRGIPENFLRSLQRRFPYGKIYNFGDDGLLSSSDEQSSSDSAVPRLVESTRGQNVATSAKRKRMAESDSTKIQNIFPGLRSFAILPMYDMQRARHLAGAVAWSYNPARLFSFQDDLNYLSAFCDVLMAEVGRLESQNEARSKTNFISSISHELRSPLHGILGGVEFLQEDADNPDTRAQMVQMIDTCGRSLLDIINNLLEHAHASAFAKSKVAKLRRHNGAVSATSSEPVHDLAVLAEEVLDSAMMNTPQSQQATRGQTGHQALRTLANDQTLKIILDLDPTNLPPSGWNFHINAGAFRRILQNITVNAIKYTDNGGYLKLGLSLVKDSQHGRTSMIELECTDSGRGMSEDFLKNGLWKAFQQEDSYATGTGLGLSLVRSLVEEMLGTIEVRSTKDIGTSVIVRLPLVAGTQHDPELLDSDDARKLRALTFALVGFDDTIDQNVRSSTATDLLRTSIEGVFQYLGLELLSTDADSSLIPAVHIIPERLAIATLVSPPATPERFQQGSCIVLCDSVSSSRAISTAMAKSKLFPQAAVMAQPVGPRQLLKTLTVCLNKSAKTPSRRTTFARTESDTSSSTLTTPASEQVPSDLLSSNTDGPATQVQARKQFSPVATRPNMSRAESSVLLVDDNAVNLTILQRYMHKLGRQQRGAINGLEALEAYQEAHSQQLDSLSPTESPLSPQLGSNQGSTASWPISIIFMDVTMPVMDGLESTRRIRAVERSLGLKPAMIVALTALASPQVRQEAYSSGVDLFITKPVRFKDIEQMFKDWEADEGSPGRAD